MPLWITEVATGPATPFWLIWSLMVMCALVALVWLLHRLRLFHLVATTPTAKIRSATQGYIEIKGRARKMPGPDIVAPLSRQDCVWYDFKVLGHSRDQALSTGFERGTCEALFWIEDGTGLCIIDPDGARVESSQSDRWYGDTQRPEIKAFGWMYDWFGRFHHRVQYSERRILEDDEIYILGEFHSMDSEREQILNQDISAILRGWKHDPVRMRGFDTNKDGRLDTEEWEIARQSADRVARQTRAERGAENTIHILRKPINAGLPFVISAQAESSIKRYYKFQALAAAAVFVIMASASMSTLWHRL